MKKAQGKRISVILLSLILLPGVWSCAPQTKARKGGVYGAAGGAAAGAGIGQAIGEDTESTLWGAAIGAALGGLAGSGVGHMMDQQEKEFEQALADSEAANVQRQGDLLELTLKGDVSFDKDSAKINPGFLDELDRIAAVMQRYPNTYIQVEGHTDSTGSESYNMDLSKRRARNVKNELISNGVSTSRIRTIGYGETMPVATNTTKTGRLLNRRVEIKIAPSDYES